MNFNDFKNVNPTERNIPDEMNNSWWQEYFNSLKLIVAQSSNKRMRCGNRYATVNGKNEMSYFVYDGDTQWERYCKFINDVLSTIRRGETDYCYYIYQIADLLRFEHDRLQAVWSPEYECFEVSLKKTNTYQQVNGKTAF